MRPAEGLLGGSEGCDCELVVVEPGVLGVELDVEALDGLVLHLHVEVVGVSEGCGGVDVGDFKTGFGPDVEGMRFGGFAGAVAVFPPDFCGVLFVDHHGVGVGSYAS